ncbi:MAG: hypothetical protein EOP89_04825 [Lysobacteraceae bacterium]|nr:MAG: hypothetical protein EOP89_04825 [Xanthomonadaceae bacterium]
MAVSAVHEVMIEANVATRVRLVLQKLGVTLFRNTVGVFFTMDKRTGEVSQVRCGLGNGSSDYIGWTEYVVLPSDVGRRVAIFTAIETKRSKGGRKSEDQERFIARVREVGGIAGFANSPEAAVEAIDQFTVGAPGRPCKR